MFFLKTEKRARIPGTANSGGHLTHSEKNNHPKKNDIILQNWDVNKPTLQTL